MFCYGINPFYGLFEPPPEGVYDCYIKKYGKYSHKERIEWFLSDSIYPEYTDQDESPFQDVYSLETLKFFLNKRNIHEAWADRSEYRVPRYHEAWSFPGKENQIKYMRFIVVSVHNESVTAKIVSMKTTPNPDAGDKDLINSNVLIKPDYHGSIDVDILKYNRSLGYYENIFENKWVIEGGFGYLISGIRESDIDDSGGYSWTSGGSLKMPSYYTGRK